MASIVDKIQKMWNQTDDDEEEFYEDEEEQVEEKWTAKEENNGPSLFKKNNKIVNINSKAQLQVIVYKPVSYGQDTREMANSLMQNNAVVLNLENTKSEDAKRILDFLSGVAFAQNGKIKKVATATYIITPANVELSGEELFDEFENHGVYF